MHRADLILGLLLLGAFGYMLVELQGMRWQTAVAPGLSALAGLLLVLHHLVTTGLRLWRAGQQGERGQERLYTHEDALPIIGFVASVAMVVSLGFAFGGVLFVFLSVLGATRGRWVVALVCAAPVYPFFALLIDRALGIVMFEGLLIRWLVG
jgi:hypothetical protein